MSTTKRRENFERLAKQAESDFKHNPNGYKRKLKWLAYLGYGYLFFILLLCIGFIATMVYLAITSSWFWVLLIKKKLIIVVVLIIYTIFKAVTVKIPPPAGYRLSRKQAPELFNHLDNFRKKLKTTKIHEVLITTEFNAAIQQTPRFGVFGWHRNSLILGAELLASLNQQQVLSVIAHEMGHLSGDHAKFNAWIYRVRMTWMHIVNTMGHLNGIVTWVFGKFFNWYAPYFNAYSFALARTNEYEADEIAVQLTSADDFSTALCKVFVLNELISQNYWSELERKAYKIEKIEDKAVSNLNDLMQNWKYDISAINVSIAEIMQLKTNYSDTHPALSDRLAPLNVKPDFDYEIEKSASNTWFPTSFKIILSKLDEMWADENTQNWQALYEQGQNAYTRLEQLQTSSEKLNKDELVEKANIINVLYGQKKAETIYKQIRKLDANEPSALYNLGTALIARKNNKGLTLLNKLMHHEDYMMHAGEVLHDYYIRNDMESQAQQILLAMESKQDRNDAFMAEVSSLSIKDKIIKDDLKEDENKQLQSMLNKLSFLDEVWIAKKELPHYTDERLYIIAYKLKNKDDSGLLFKQLESSWPIQSMYFALSFENKKLFKIIKKTGRKLL